MQMNERIIIAIESRLDGTHNVDETTRFREELPLSSFDYMVLVYDIEREFGVKMDFLAFAQCVTVRDLSNLVSTLVDGGSE